jgi:hypothetical protein
MLTEKLCKNRDSSVGKATGYGLDDRMIGVRFPAGAGNFALRHRVQTSSVAQPASYPMGTRTLSLGLKRPVREADHSPPSSVEVNECVEIYLHSPIAIFIITENCVNACWLVTILKPV